MSTDQLSVTEGLERIEFEPTHYGRFHAYLLAKMALVDTLAALDLLRKNKPDERLRVIALRGLSHLLNVENSKDTTSFVVFGSLGNPTTYEESLNLLQKAKSSLETQQVDEISFKKYITVFGRILSEMDKNFKEDQAKVFEPLRHERTLY